MRGYVKAVAMRNGAGFAAPLALVQAHLRAIINEENLALAEALRASRRARERARRFALSAAEVDRLEAFGRDYLVSEPAPIIEPIWRNAEGRVVELAGQAGYLRVGGLRCRDTDALALGAGLDAPDWMPGGAMRKYRAGGWVCAAAIDIPRGGQVWL